MGGWVKGVNFDKQHFKRNERVCYFYFKNLDNFALNQDEKHSLSKYILRLHITEGLLTLKHEV